MKSIGYSVVYPHGCKELSEDLKIDELRRRINDLSSSFDKILDEESCNGENTFDGDTSLDVRHDNLKGLFLMLTSEYTRHPDRDVQLRVAVCILKLLKIFCPQNPFSELMDEKTRTKELLTFLLTCIQLLSGIRSKSDASYPKLHTILYICCQIDIFLWCAALEDETVLFECVKTTFSVIKNLSVWAWTEPAIIRQKLLDMIVKVIIQAEGLLSREIVTFLLLLLIEPAKSTQPEQHTFSRDLILRTARHLEYNIQMLLQSSLIAGMDNSNTTPDVTEESEADMPPETNSEDNVLSSKSSADPLGEHAFLIMYALHTIQDSIISPVLPTIELKLRSTSSRDRKRAFRLLARLFSEPNSVLHEKCPGLWNAFLGRFNDIDEEVRKLCVHMVPQLLKQNPDLPRASLLGCIQQRAHDSVEDVRLLVLRTVSTLVNDSPADITWDLYILLKERSRDKSLLIRKEAATSLATVYKHVSKEPHQQTESLSLAANAIMHMYYHPSIDDKIIVERLFKSSLVPYHLDTVERVRALFTCYGLLDEASVRAMQEIFKVQHSVIGLVRDVLQVLSEEEGKKISSQAGVSLMDRLHHLAAVLPKSDKCVEHLKRFFNQVHVDKSLRGQLVKLTRPTCTCVQATNIMRELLKRVDTGSGSSSDAQLNYIRTVKVLLERSAPVLFDKDFGQELLTQLVVIREAGPTPGLGVSLHIVRALRLLHLLSVYFKRVLPTDEVMDYLVGILSSGEWDPMPISLMNAKSDEYSPTILDTDPPTVQELALSILCCLLGGTATLSGDTDPTNANKPTTRLLDSHFYGSESNLEERSRDFLPLLKQFCSTGLTQRFPSVPFSLQSETGTTTSCGTRIGRGKSSRNETQAHSGINHSAQSVYLAGLAWRRERRRSKLATQVILCMLRVAKRFRSSTLKSSSTAAKGLPPKDVDSTPDVDLDVDISEPDVDDIGDFAKGDNDESTSQLEADIQNQLNEIVQVCLSCPVDSPNYVTCLISLGRIALQLPGVYNREFKKFMTKSLVQQVLMLDQNLVIQSASTEPPVQAPNSTKAPLKSKNVPSPNTQILSPKEWLDDGYISQATRIKIAAVKLMTSWLRGLRNEVKPVAQAIIRLLHRIIIHDGDLTRQGRLMPGEMSRMRLVAAVSWLKLAYSQSYVESIEVDWYQSMTYIICDPCPQVRSYFLAKLNQGLYRLRLPLEYMAMFAHAVDVPDVAFKQRAKQFLLSNIQRRREFLDRHPSYLKDPKFFYGLLPEFILPHLVYLLAHDPEWSDLNDVHRLNRIKSSLWFVMEPIVTRGHNFVFLRKIIEKLKHTRDARSPDDEIANTKLYIICDVALGLLLTRSSDLTIKEYPVDVKLPKSLFVAAPSGFKNPDFAQLLDPALEVIGRDGTSTDIGVAKPLIQFTPAKAGRSLKDGLMPPELLKDRRPAGPGSKVVSTEPVPSTSRDLQPSMEIQPSIINSHPKRLTKTKQSKLVLQPTGDQNVAVAQPTCESSAPTSSSDVHKRLEEIVPDHPKVGTSHAKVLSNKRRQRNSPSPGSAKRKCNVSSPQTVSVSSGVNRPRKSGKKLRTVHKTTLAQSTASSHSKKKISSRNPRLRKSAGFTKPISSDNLHSVSPTSVVTSRNSTTSTPTEPVRKRGRPSNASKNKQRTSRRSALQARMNILLSISSSQSSVATSIVSPKRRRS